MDRQRGGIEEPVFERNEHVDTRRSLTVNTSGSILHDLQNTLEQIEASSPAEGEVSPEGFSMLDKQIDHLTEQVDYLDSRFDMSKCSDVIKDIRKILDEVSNACMLEELSWGDLNQKVEDLKLLFKQIPETIPREQVEGESPVDNLDRLLVDGFEKHTPEQWKDVFVEASKKIDILLTRYNEHIPKPRRKVGVVPAKIKGDVHSLQEEIKENADEDKSSGYSQKLVSRHNTNILLTPRPDGVERKIVIFMTDNPNEDRSFVRLSLVGAGISKEERETWHQCAQAYTTNHVKFETED